MGSLAMVWPHPGGVASGVLALGHGDAGRADVAAA